MNQKGEQKMEKRLYRSTTDKHIGGVCGGLAEYFAIDPSLVRVGFILMVLFHGVGLLAYLVLWIAVRQQPKDVVPSDVVHRSSSWGKYLPGLILIILGVFFLIRENWYWYDLDYYFEQYWPILFIALGVILLVFHGRSHRSQVDQNIIHPQGNHQNGGASI
jgi:phage shock protein C